MQTTSIHKDIWKQELANCITNIDQLCEFLELGKNQLNLLSNPQFPLRIPYSYAAKIKKQTPNDPLLMQVLPQTKEIIQPSPSSKYCHDPLSEAKFTKVPGLIHKYKSRILLTLTSACGIHCRYCFRQYFPYSENVIASKNRHLQLDYIENNKQITEVILSGGDPLCVNNSYLNQLFEQINQIKHIKTIRLHSRMPIVIPSRIDQGIIDIINKFPKLKFILVTHTNHSNELDDMIKSKMKKLTANNITVLNQSVLLKGINDTAGRLINLSQRLFDCNIIPYYLHMLDSVTGTAHFEVNIEHAKAIMQELRAELPGYLVPKLVTEIAGQPSKTPII